MITDLKMFKDLFDKTGVQYRVSTNIHSGKTWLYISRDSIKDNYDIDIEFDSKENFVQFESHECL